MFRVCGGIDNVKITNGMERVTTMVANINRRHILLHGLCACAAGLQVLLASSKTFGADRTRKGKRRMATGKGERIEPLFLSQGDARTILHDYCVDGWEHPLTPAQVDLLLARLSPQLWIVAGDGEGEIGATRFGGAPDMHKEAVWPMRAAMPDQAKLAAVGRFPNPWIVRQLSETVPFEFVAQIDLKEAGHHPDSAKGLPQSGRLLFFIDDALLMHEPSGNPVACRVMLDETLPGDLSRLVVPARFEDMEMWWRKPDPKLAAQLERSAERLETSGQGDAAKAMRDVSKSAVNADPSHRKPFVYPARAMKLVPILTLPNVSAIEVSLDADLKRLLDDDEAGEHYQRLTANDVGPFTTAPDDMRVSQPWLMREARRNRLMGAPHPEQDDPRFNAIPEAERPPYPWNDEQVAAMSRKANDWQMLLQVSVADLSQQQREGTLYFMVRRDDLARRDFSRAVATYQQT